MAAMAFSQSKYGGSDKATLTPEADSDEWPVDLGTLSDLRTHGASGPVFITLETSVGSVKWGFGFNSDGPGSGDLIVSHIEWPRGREDSSQEADRTPRSQIPELSFSQPIAASGTILKGLVEHPTHRTFTRLNSQQWREQPDNAERRVELLGLVLNTATHPGGTSVPLNVPILNEIRAVLQNLIYLRATRRRPIRAYDESRLKLRQVVGYSGEKTAFVLRHRGADPIIVKLPPVIPDSPSETKALLDRDWEEYSGTLLEVLGIWLQRLHLANSVGAIEREDDRSLLQVLVTLQDQRAHDITEVGFGISQILPVLVAGLLQSKDSLLVVDLPEAHLHPWPQAQLADFFLSLTLSGRQVLVETHSEMFINQLRLRAELNQELQESIAVYFIDSPVGGYCCLPRRIEFGTEGEMRWPAGFMQEALDIETKISAVRAAKRRQPK
jgi:predicted ATPase